MDEDQVAPQTTDQPDVAPADAKFVAQWTQRIRAAKAFHKKAFDRMRENMSMAYLGADGEWIATGNYTANIIQRQVSQKVAQLYAKNPRASAKPRPRLYFQLWDGKMETAAAAYQSFTMNPADLQSAAMLKEIADAQQRMTMLNRMGKTTEILFHYFLDEQEPRFKPQMKQAVRRAAVTGVAYIELGFQRIMEVQPDITARINDVTNQIAYLERLTGEMAAGEIDPEDADVVELQSLLSDLQEKEKLITREGPLFLFPRSTAIIVDTKCTQLQGFIGAEWIAKEHTGTADRVKETYKIEIGKNYRSHESSNMTKFERAFEGLDKDEKGADQCVWWEVYHKPTGQVFTIADGYKGFLKRPARPTVTLERFWPIFSLTFNGFENDKEVYPISDVKLITPMQEEYNRSRQGLREHRQANRPKYFTGKGMLSKEDKDLLASHPANAILELNAVQPGVDVNTLLRKFDHSAIDPALYDTSPLMEDILRQVGAQEANLGGTSGATATESSIAEGSRMSTQSSDVDELDETLIEIARATGQLMLMELSLETVQEIAGPGAVWPELSREQIAKEIGLEIKAGSSGRPNRAAEIANFERLAPTLLQVPGITPQWLAQKAVNALDEGVSIEEAVMEGLPSIVAMNAMARGTGGGAAQPSTGDATTDPASQGSRGNEVNTNKSMRGEPGPQPAYPAPLTPM